MVQCSPRLAKCVITSDAGPKYATYETPGDNSLNCLLCTIHQHSGPHLSLCEEQESIKHVKHPGGGLVNGGDNHLVLFACQ